MSRPPKDPLRPLSEEEEHVLEHVSRSPSQPAVHVTRAKALLAVASGQNYTQAARRAGYRVGDTVGELVARFIALITVGYLSYNVEGLGALQPRHAGGTPASYGVAQTERILAQVRRAPNPKADGTATWSLSLLKASLRQAPDGLPHVSTYTIWRVLRESGYSWQKRRSWCETGTVKRKRKSGVVTVRDPDAVAQKKFDRTRAPAGGTPGTGGVEGR
jgi:transposase